MKLCDLFKYLLWSYVVVETNIWWHKKQNTKLFYHFLFISRLVGCRQNRFYMKEFISIIMWRLKWKLHLFNHISLKCYIFFNILALNETSKPIDCFRCLCKRIDVLFWFEDSLYHWPNTPFGLFIPLYTEILINIYRIIRFQFKSSLLLDHQSSRQLDNWFLHSIICCGLLKV